MTQVWLLIKTKHGFQKGIRVFYGNKVYILKIANKKRTVTVR